MADQMVAPRGDAFAAARRYMAAQVETIREVGSRTDAALGYDLTLPIGVLRGAEHFILSERAGV